jgi:hypothetical protein
MKASGCLSKQIEFIHSSYQPTHIIVSYMVNPKII